MAEQSHLYDQLVKLGDMMGNGLHHEPDGAWIEREYRNVCIALGLLEPKRRRKRIESPTINKAMVERLREFKCPKCSSEMKQTRSGSLRARCTKCSMKMQVLKRKTQNH